MSVSAVNGGSIQPVQNGKSFANAKQAFDDLEGALKSGDLSAAKAAFARFQKNAPPPPKGTNDPIGQKVDTLGKALSSGDLSAAQSAFADLKKTISQRPGPASAGDRAGGAPPGGPPGGGGPPRGGRPGGSKSGSSDNSTSSFGKVYDIKDTNKDGTVSVQEERAYDLTHSTTTTQSSDTSSTATEQTGFDAYA